MKSITIDTMKETAFINNVEYPMFSGFLSADKIRLIANVPSFDEDKEHHQISTDISKLPVDQWQRPLDEKKSNMIKTIYSKDNKDNLMANPILLGIAKPSISDNVNVIIKKKTIKIKSEIVEIPNLYELIITYTDLKKPIWILDGQHRVDGMNKSTQMENPIPFVLLYDEDVYSPPFLAEIFTHVTTGATPMQELHAEWMKFAFKLGKYANFSPDQSMKACIALCREVHLGDDINPLHNKIQFNPYNPTGGYYAFNFDCIEWVNIISENYYGRNGSLDPTELAEEIFKSIRAFRKIDTHRDNDSRLFSNRKPHKILAEGYLSGLLKYIAANDVGKDEDEWESFLRSKDRVFHKCDWSLQFVKGQTALSSSYAKASKTIAKECFDDVFNQPSLLNGALFTDYLSGVGAAMKLIAYQKTSAGRKSNINTHDQETSLIGKLPFDMNYNNIVREILRIEPVTHNCHILKVENINVRPSKNLPDATRMKGLDISKFQSGSTIEITSMSYSADTVATKQIRLDR